MFMSRFSLHLLPKITALCISRNNHTSTVLELFLAAVDIHSHPSCVHGDHGGGNVLISAYMIMRHGPHQGLFLWGRQAMWIHLYLSHTESYTLSSTHNTRIERLWVEVGQNFCRSWHAFFGCLDSQFGLDCSDPTHIWLL